MSGYSLSKRDLEGLPHQTVHSSGRSYMGTYHYTTYWFNEYRVACRAAEVYGSLSLVGVTKKKKKKR